MKPTKKKLSKAQRLVNRATPTRYGVAGSGEITKTRVEEMNNALCYVRQLLQPELSAEIARMPEATPYPSSVSRTKFSNVLTNVVDGTGGNYVGGIIVRPFMNQHFLGLTAYDHGAITETWATNEHPSLATFTSNFACWRCVGLSVRVKCSTKLLDRGGLLYMWRAMQPPSATLATTVNVANMLGSVEYSTIDLAEIPPEGVMINWLPVTLQSSIFTGSSNFNGPTGSAYRLDVSGTVFGRDSFIGFFYTSTVAQVLNFEIVGCWEELPLVTTKLLFESKAIPGSEGDIATAMRLVDRGLSDRGASTTFSDVANQVGGFLTEGYNAVKSVLGSPIFKGISQIGASLLTSGGGMMQAIEVDGKQDVVNKRARLSSALVSEFPDYDYDHAVIDYKVTDSAFLRHVIRNLIDIEKRIAGESTNSLADLDDYQDIKAPELRRSDTVRSTYFSR